MPGDEQHDEPLDPVGRTIASSGTLSVAAAAKGTSTEEDAPQLLANRYVLLGMLGAGAMGTVYRALDRELDEVVALKVLKKEIATSEMVERFRREVKLARRVTHKNVARTYDIGEHGGDRFLTMEFIDGEMLASRLAWRGRLPISEVIKISLEICGGLSAAHAAGVLHRDLKPENVILSKDADRGAVITDFGIARATQSADALSATIGGIAGTPAYMAPEQVEGSTDLDARADLYALGTMMFELISGRMAWEGDSIVTVAAGRLLKPPPDLRAVMPNMPPGVAEVVLKLMARQRDDRFPSADATIVALEALGVATTAATPLRTLNMNPVTVATPVPVVSPLTSALKTSPTPGTRVVAVLPMLNQGAAEDAYLVECVNEDLIDLLSVAPGLLVRPRGETAAHVASTRNVREIGRTVGANVVVDGSLRRIGETVRASIRLIAVEDGFQLWAKRFDRPPNEVLSIADDAAQAIAKALTAEAPAQRVRTADAEAEDLYLRGRSLLRRGWHSASREAVEILGRAYDRAGDDPRIVGTYALSLARVYGLEHCGREVAERAREIAARAMALEPEQPEARVALGTINLQNGEADAAVVHLQQALLRAPNSIDALDWLGRIMVEIDRVEDGIALLEKAYAIDPEYETARHQIARIRGLLGDRAGLLGTLGEMPKHPADIAPWFLVQCRDVLWHRDKVGAETLLAKLDRTVELPPSARFPITAVLEVAMGLGQRLADHAVVDRTLPIDASRPPRRAAFNAQMRVELFSAVGDTAASLENLKHADSNGCFDIVWLERCPLLGELRAHPDYPTVHEHVRVRALRIAQALSGRQVTTLVR